MAQRKAHHIWIEQCEAAQTIKARFGLSRLRSITLSAKNSEFCQCRLDTSRVRTRTATVRFRGEADVHAR
jgi:hypothetical protein